MLHPANQAIFRKAPTRSPGKYRRKRRKQGRSQKAGFGAAAFLRDRVIRKHFMLHFVLQTFLICDI
jgi:hypothetical protein